MGEGSSQDIVQGGEETHTVQTVGFTAVTTRFARGTRDVLADSGSTYYKGQGVKADDPWDLLHYQIVFDLDCLSAPSAYKQTTTQKQDITAALDVGALSTLTGLTSLMGVDGTIFGLEPFDETIKAAEDAGFTRDGAARLVSETIMQFVQVKGVLGHDKDMEENMPVTGNEFPTQYRGQTPALAVENCNAGDLAEAVCLTPVQMEQLYKMHDNQQMFYNKNQLPLFFRPMTRHSLTKTFESWVELYVKSPYVYNKLIKNQVTQQLAMTAGLENFMRMIRAIVTFGIYGLTRSSGLTLVPIARPDLKDTRQKFSNKPSYAERPINHLRDFERIDGDRYVFKLDDLAGKIEPCAAVRRAFICYNGRIVKDGDIFIGEEAIAASMATEPETIACILGVGFGLIKGSRAQKTGSKFTGLLQNLIDQENAKMDELESKKQDPQDPKHGFLTNSFFDLENIISRTILLGYNRNDTKRSEYEFFDIVNPKGKALGNPATSDGVNGRIHNYKSEFGRMLLLQNNAVSLGMAASIQVVMNRLQKVKGFFTRTNTAGNTTAMYMTGNIRVS